MSAFEQLPPDQRATLSLLLRRHKSYAEVAEMLEIAPGAVHDRAHAALAVLAPSLARQLSAALREEVGEYLLGQQQPAEAQLTRSRIAASAPAREWAKALAVELVHVTADQLPEIPEPAQEIPGRAPAGERAANRKPQLPGKAEPDEQQPVSRDPWPATGGPQQPVSRDPWPATGGPAAAPQPGVDFAEDQPGEPRGPRVSRRGGFALLGVIAAVVIVAIVLVVSSGKGSGSSAGKLAAGQAEETETTKSAGEESAESSTNTSTTSSSSINAEDEIALTAPAGGKATGGVEFASEKGKRAFLIAAEHLEPPKGFEYVAWLVNSKGEAIALGIAKVTKEGKLYAGNELPEDVSSYDVFELTRNTGSKPAKPGPVALEGTFKLS